MLKNLRSGFEIDQTNGVGILGNMTITYPKANIHNNINEDYRCTLIVGEWKPTFTDLWKYVLRQLFTDPEGNESFVFEGTVQEDQSTPEITTEKNVEFEVLWPNIEFVQTYESETPGEYISFPCKPSYANAGDDLSCIQMRYALFWGKILEEDVIGNENTIMTNHADILLWNLGWKLQDKERMEKYETWGYFLE